MSSFTSRFTELDICPSEFTLKETATISSTKSSYIYQHVYLTGSDPGLYGKSNHSLACSTIPEQRATVDLIYEPRHTKPSADTHFQGLAKKFKRFINSIHKIKNKTSMSSSPSSSFTG